MLRLVLLLVTLMLAACSPITISIGAPTATATWTPTLPPPTATATATPDLTATAQVHVTATAQAEATSQAGVQATTAAILAQRNATFTAQAKSSDATATAQANATATVQAARVATKNALLAFVDALVAKADRPSRFTNGELTSSRKILNTDLRPKNFVVDMEFGNPADPKVHQWDLMFMFRYSSVENRFFLVLHSTGTWSLLYPGQRQADRTTTEVVSSGTMPTLNVSPTGSNKVRLVVYENAGFLCMNGELAGMMDLSKNPSSGELWITSGMMIGDDFPGLVMPYKNLVISGLQ